MYQKFGMSYTSDWFKLHLRFFGRKVVNLTSAESSWSWLFGWRGWNVVNILASFMGIIWKQFLSNEFDGNFARVLEHCLTSVYLSAPSIQPYPTEFQTTNRLTPPLSIFIHNWKWWSLKQENPFKNTAGCLWYLSEISGVFQTNHASWTTCWSGCTTAQLSMDFSILFESLFWVAELPHSFSIMHPMTDPVTEVIVVTV